MEPIAGRHGPPIDTRTVLGKVVTVLQAFSADDQGVSLAELGRRTGLPKGTLHRLVTDLVAVRLLDKDGTSYALSRQLFELGMRASVERQLLEVATPYMEDLYERTHETVHLGVLDSHHVVYVAKIGGHRQVSSPSRVGGRMPLHCTAIGKALLAYGSPQLFAEVVEQGLARLTPRTITAPGLLRKQLVRVVETGAAFEYEESARGICCVAAPVFGSNEQPAAAISVTGPATRFQPEKHAVSVRTAASGVAAALTRRATMTAR